MRRAIGLAFEALLIRLLKPVLPAALPPPARPWLWALGALVLISLLVGLRPYRQLLATQPLRVLRRDVVASVWPLRYFLPVTAAIVVALLVTLMGPARCCGRSRRYGGAGAAAGRYRLG